MKRLALAVIALTFFAVPLGLPSNVKADAINDGKKYCRDHHKKNIESKGKVDDKKLEACANAYREGVKAKNPDITKSAAYCESVKNVIKVEVCTDAFVKGAKNADTSEAPQQSDCGDKCQLPGGPSDLSLPKVSLSDGVASIIALLSFIAGVLSVFFIVLSGIKYASTSGDPQRIESAKQTLLYAVIGLIVSLMAFAIVGFVLSNSP